MAVKVKTRKGKTITLLNPQEKRDKYFKELKTGVARTNTGKVKYTKNGKPKKLSGKQKSYRVGYIGAQNDSAACFKAKRAKRATRYATKRYSK